MDSGTAYKVIVAPTADSRYVSYILPYIEHNFSFDRLIEIDKAIGEMVDSLTRQPYRGSKEFMLKPEGREFRYILFRETRHFELKILYYVDEESSTVFVVDYFPTLMHPKSMTKPR